MEFLKELLSEEAYNKLEEELKDKDVKLVDLRQGEYVSVDKYNTAIKDLESTREELAQRTEDLSTLKDSKDVSDELKAKIEKLEQEFAEKEQKYQETLKHNEKESIFEKELLKNGAIDTLAVKAHLREFLEEAEVEEGQIVGLNEKISEFKEEKAYLFNQPNNATGVKHPSTPPKKEVTLQEDILNKVYKKEGE